MGFQKGEHGSSRTDYSQMEGNTKEFPTLKERFRAQLGEREKGKVT